MTRLATDPEAALPFFCRAADHGAPGDYFRGCGWRRRSCRRGLMKRRKRSSASCRPSARTARASTTASASRRRRRQDDPAALREFTAAASSPFARQKAYAALAAVQERLGNPTAAAECNRLAAASPPDWPWPDRYVAELAGVEVSRKGRYLAADMLEARGRARKPLAFCSTWRRTFPTRMPRSRPGRPWTSWDALTTPRPISVRPSV